MEKNNWRNFNTTFPISFLSAIWSFARGTHRCCVVAVSVFCAGTWGHPPWFLHCLNAASRIEPPLPPRLPPPHNRPLSAPGLRHSALRHNLFTVRTYLLWRPTPCGQLTTSSNLGQHSTCVISVYYIKEQTDKNSLEGMGKFTGIALL